MNNKAAVHNRSIIKDERAVRIRYQKRSYFLMVILFFIASGVVLYFLRDPIISPCPDSGCASMQFELPKTIDSMVDMYANKYGKTKWTKLRTKTILHYLLLREAAYGNTKTCGDSGKACGPLQFWEATYISYRNIMISRGLTTVIGSRWDMEQAIETAAWAINDGRERAWGPIARGEIKL